MSSNDWMRKSFPVLARLSDKEILRLIGNVKGANGLRMITNIIAICVGVFSIIGLIALYFGIDLIRDPGGWVLVVAIVVISLLSAFFNERRLIILTIKKKKKNL